MYQKLKSIGTKLILTVLIFVTLFNLITPTYSLAGEWYGILVDPISDLVCSIGDALMNLMQNMLIPGAPVAVTPRQLLTVNGQKVDYTQPVMEKVNGENRVVGYKNENGETVRSSGLPSILLGGLSNTDMSWQDIAIPKIYYSPAAIFTNRIPALNINFITPLTQETFNKQYSVILSISEEIAGKTPDETFYAEMKKEYGWNKEQAATAWSLAGAMEKIKDDPSLWDSYLGGTLKKESSDSTTTIGNPLANSAVIIAPVISKWYIALRNLAITGLLIVLVYIGIRILIASISEEKAKYKEMLKNWVMAIVLIFVLHYIMLGLITVTEKVTDFLDGAVYTTQTAGRTTVQEDGQDMQQQAEATWNADPQDKLFNEVREKESLAKFDDETVSSTIDKFGYAVMYAVLVIYTLIFTFKYLKRMVYMVFLTMISPMIALTYPIDKIGDSKAQALNMWFREYFFNLIIQPVHLLIYTVLVASAIEFAKTNMLYAIVAIAFIMEAENIIKRMFGIHAEGGEFVDFAAGAALSGGLSMIGRAASSTASAIGNIGNSSGGGTGPSDNGKVRQQNIKDPDAKIGLVEAFGNNATENNATGNSTTENNITGNDTIGNDTIGGNGGNSPNSKVIITESGKEETLNLLQGGGKDDLEGKDSSDGTVRTVNIENPEVPDIASITPNLDASSSTPRIATNISPNAPTAPKRKIKKAVGGVKNVIGSNVRRLTNKNTVVKLAKFATKASVGTLAVGTLGTIGLAAGLASNQKLGQITGVGLASGVALTGAAIGIGSKAISGTSNAVRTVHSDYQRGALTKEEKQAKENKKWRDAYLRDPRTRQKFQDEYGEKAEIMMKYWDEAARYGTPDKDVLKLMDKGMNAQQAMTVVDIAKNDISRKDLVNVNSDARQALDKRIKSVIKDEKQQKQVWDSIHEINHVDPKEIREKEKKEIRKKRKAKKEHAEQQREEDEQGRKRVKNQQEKYKTQEKDKNNNQEDKDKKEPDARTRNYKKPPNGNIPNPWDDPNSEK